MADNGITNSTFITDDRIVDSLANNLPPYKISNWIEVCHRLGLADDAIEVEKRNHINGTLAFTGLVRWMLKTWYCCYPNEANITNLISIMKTLHFGLAAEELEKLANSSKSEQRQGSSSQRLDSVATEKGTNNAAKSNLLSGPVNCHELASLFLSDGQILEQLSQLFNRFSNVSVSSIYECKNEKTLYEKIKGILTAWRSANEQKDCTVEHLMQILLGNGDEMKFTEAAEKLSIKYELTAKIQQK